MGVKSIWKIRDHRLTKNCPTGRKDGGGEQIGHYRTAWTTAALTAGPTGGPAYSLRPVFSAINSLPLFTSEMVFVYVERKERCSDLPTFALKRLVCQTCRWKPRPTCCRTAPSSTCAGPLCSGEQPMAFSTLPRRST